MTETACGYVPHPERVAEAARTGAAFARGGFPRVAPADMSPPEWQAWLDAWDAAVSEPEAA